MTGPDRLPAIPDEAMSPDQKRVADAIRSGPRKGLPGPMNAWLRSPVLADHLQRVGEYIRFNSSLPLRLNELAILMTARRWDAQFEWYAHHALAMEAGLEPDIAAAIAEGRRPDRMGEDETLVYEFCEELRREKGVSDALYARVVAAFGEQGLVDLIAVNGYYDLVSMTLNVARVPVPGGEMPLKPLVAPNGNDDGRDEQLS